MTITLDDVSNLLYLPVIDQFYKPHAHVDVFVAIDVAAELLVVDLDDATSETRAYKGYTRGISG